MNIVNLTKCGEIFHTTKGDLNYLCFICSDLFDTSNEFEVHQLQTHFPKSKQSVPIVENIGNEVAADSGATADNDDNNDPVTAAFSEDDDDDYIGDELQEICKELQNTNNSISLTNDIDEHHSENLLTQMTTTSPNQLVDFVDCKQLEFVNDNNKQTMCAELKEDNFMDKNINSDDKYIDGDLNDVVGQTKQAIDDIELVSKRKVSKIFRTGIGKSVYINCPICKLKLSLASMVRHINKHKPIKNIDKYDNICLNSEGKYLMRCPVCQEFLNVSMLHNHVKKYHNNSSENADKNVKQKDKLCGNIKKPNIKEKKKLRINLPLNPTKVALRKYMEITCPLCQKILSLASIARHIRTHKDDLHFSTDMYKSRCAICREELSICSMYQHLLTKHKTDIDDPDNNDDNDDGDDHNDNNVNNDNIDNNECDSTNNKAKLFLTNCPICRKPCSINTLKEHICGKHSIQPNQLNELLTIKCSICEKLLSSTSMIRHLFSSHNIDNKTKCRECKKIIYYTNFEQHQHIYHGKKMTCDICNEQFNNRHNFVEHLRWHRNNNFPPRSCTICDKYFKHSAALRAHMRIVHTDLRSFQCEICGKSYAFAFQLNHHIKIHKTPKKPCPICKKMLSHFTFHNHIKAHSNERPYKCKLCDKSFKYTKVLNVHEKIHLSEKKHKCKYCDMVFSQTSGRRSHEKRVHNIIKQ